MTLKRQLQIGRVAMRVAIVSLWVGLALSVFIVVMEVRFWVRWG